MGLIREFSRDMNVVAEPRPSFGLPWSAMEAVLPDSGDGVIAVLTPRQLEIQSTDDPVAIEIWFRGMAFRFPAATRPLFQYLNDSSPVSIREFYQRFHDECGYEELRAFVADLVKHGIVVVHEPEMR